MWTLWTIKKPTLRSQAHCQVAKSLPPKPKLVNKLASPVQKKTPSCQQALILHSAICCKYEHYAY